MNSVMWFGLPVLFLQNFCTCAGHDKSSTYRIFDCKSAQQKNVGKVIFQSSGCLLTATKELLAFLG